MMLIPGLLRCAIRSGRVAVAFGSMIALAVASHHVAAQPRSMPAYLRNFPNFAATPTPAFPGDVDIALKKKLEAEKQFAAVQRLFDLNAWQMFLAVNWPTNDQGRPARSIADTKFGPPHWTLWQTSSQVFRTDGLRPAACPRPAGRMRLEAVARGPAPLLPGLPLLQRPAGASPRSVLLLANLSAVGNLSTLDLKGGEINQAFSGPLIDQNGNFVHYDIAIDPNEFRYICDTGIYSINGQIAFSRGKPHPVLDFPSGSDARDWSGATELKLAWKILDPAKGDQPRRFFTMQAVIPTPDGKGQRQVLVGLVGMHIAHKSQSSPQWIWATFEQVDNLVGNALAHPPIKASFTNPNCEICVPNLDPKVTKDFKTPTQAWRAIPIPGDKVQLNRQAEAALAKLGSAWQYYQLIDTQWPTQPSKPPTPWTAGLPDAINNKSGGFPTPVFLTNITMETYFQKGVQPACEQEHLPPGVSCPPASTAPSNAPKADTTPVFATESCMGCHASAGLIVSYDPKTKKTTTAPQLSGDFSWLPLLKANYAPGLNR